MRSILLFFLVVCLCIVGIQADVEKILTNLKHPLQHQSISEDLKLRLRRLELRGELTKINIQLELEALKDKLSKNQLLRLREDIEDSLAQDVWTRRFFRGTMAADDDTWRVAFLTPRQNRIVSETLRRSVQQVQDLGSPEWWARVKDELVASKVEDVDRVVEAIRDKVDEYKVIVARNTPSPPPPKEWIPWLKAKLLEWFDCYLGWWRHQFDSTSVASEQATSSYAAVAAHAKSAELAVQSIETHAKQQAKSLKQSFAQFWLEKEKDAWERIGYTETQLQWLHHHLETTFRNKATLAKSDVDKALHTVRWYLQQARIQSATEIEHQITRLQLLLEDWKQSLPTEP